MPAFLIILTLLFANIGAVYAASSSCDRVVASAHPDYPPYHWREGSRIVGASVDLNKLIFAEIGVPFVAVHTGPWKRVLKTAENGGVDFLMSLKKTAEREKYLVYTDNPAFENPFAIFTLKSNRFPFSSWDDLKGKSGAKNAGDRYGEPFDSFVTNVLKLSDNFSFLENVNRLLVGRIDYLIHGRFVGRSQFGVIDGGENIAPLAMNAVEGFIHSGFARTSPCRKWLSYVDRRYGELMADGTTDRLLAANIGRWIADSKQYEVNKKIIHSD